MSIDDKRYPKEIWLHPTCDECDWHPDWETKPHDCYKDAYDREKCPHQSVRYIREDCVSGEFLGKTPEKWSERLDSNQRPLSPQEMD